MAIKKKTRRLPKVTVRERPVIEIMVEGGEVQDVTGPPGTTVIVRDYDVGGVDEEYLSKDREGDEYVESVYDF